MTRRIAKDLLQLSLMLLTVSTLAGCSGKEPVTLLFTGDDQGRLVPAG